VLLVDKYKRLILMMEELCKMAGQGVREDDSIEFLDL
jgi:hypothetical protein